MPSKPVKNKGDLIKKILGNGIDFDVRFISDYEKLENIVASLRECGYRICLTQGVWDMLHIGHLRYLTEAKSKGDILVVGVDTDEYTKKRKGPTRPIVPEKERLEMLAGLRCIDILTVRRHSDHPDLLVKIVRPDVLIVSSTTADVGEKERKSKSKYTKQVMVLQPQAAVSTTSRVRKLLIDGANDLAKQVQGTIEVFFKK
jgi:rfaE bifunctional protein nucleotidyltransferase chain/domain